MRLSVFELSPGIYAVHQLASPVITLQSPAEPVKTTHWTGCPILHKPSPRPALELQRSEGCLCNPEAETESPGSHQPSGDRSFNLQNPQSSRTSQQAPFPRPSTTSFFFYPVNTQQSSRFCQLHQTFSTTNAHPPKLLPQLRMASSAN